MKAYPTEKVAWISHNSEVTTVYQQYTESLQSTTALFVGTIALHDDKEFP